MLTMRTIPLIKVLFIEIEEIFKDFSINPIGVLVDSNDRDNDGFNVNCIENGDILGFLVGPTLGFRDGIVVEVLVGSTDGDIDSFGVGTFVKKTELLNILGKESGSIVG